MLLALIIFLPLFSFILVMLTGRLIGKKGSEIITISALILSLLLVLINFNFNEQSTYIELFKWLQYGPFHISFELLFDTTTYIMLIVVLTISLIVHIYSTDYLSSDPHLPRFLGFLSLFTFFMLILVSAENFIQLFLGWEGVGLCSYLLISFWFTRIQASKSALKAVFVNKIGDLALLIAMSLIYLLVGSVSFSVFFSLLPYVQTTIIYIGSTYFSLLNLIGLLLLIGVIGKSAQIGLHIWLPDAMEGPTPVSALLHAATMVTAGIFLVIRCSFFFEHTPLILTFCLFIGSLTAFFAATTGLLQNDIKKIIAFSTCSQLGYMLAACGTSQYTVALFHLFNHAFFKALLFLAAGNVIHSMLDEQDIRKMGSLYYFLPLTFSYFFIASFSLMGLPYLSGYFSKDFILEQLYSNHTNLKYFSLILLLSAAGFTAAYSYRLLFYVFLTRPNFSSFKLPYIKDARKKVMFPLICLTILSIFSGWIANDFFIGIGSTTFTHVIYNRPQQTNIINSEFLYFLYKQMPFIFSVFAWSFAYYILTKKQFNLYVHKHYYYTAMFLNQKWFFDKVYNILNLWFVKNCFYSFYSFLDKGIIEFFGPTGLFTVLQKINLKIKQKQSGVISNYFLFIFFFILFVLLFGLTIL